MPMAKGDPEAGLRAYAKHERLELVSGEAGAQAGVIQVWNEYRAAHGDDVLIATRRNADAAALNKGARLVLRAEGRLTGPNVSLAGPIELAQGDRIRFGEKNCRSATGRAGRLTVWN
jgi:hypothetical protein